MDGEMDGEMEMEMEIEIDRQTETEIDIDQRYATQVLDRQIWAVLMLMLGLRWMLVLKRYLGVKDKDGDRLL